MARWLIVGFLALLIAACGGDDEACTDEEVERLNRQAREGAWAAFGQAYVAAQNVPVDQIDESITSMQTFQSDFEDEDWDGCGDQVDEAYRAFMAEALNEIYARQNGEPAANIQEHHNEALKQFTKANSLMTVLGE